MNLEKHLEYFDPVNEINAPIHIIGVGAIGSTLAEQLARLGCTDIYLYDFDVVEEKNLTNQNFYRTHIGLNKTHAVDFTLHGINPNIKVKCYKEGYDGQQLKGYVFLCVDSIELRRQIASSQKFNKQLKAMFDFRMRLTDAQHYGCDWSEMKNVVDFLKTMAFSSDEAKEATPVNACGGALNVRYTVTSIVSLGVANFVNFVKGNPIKKMTVVDMSQFDLIAM